jgi:hypothetical protein
MPGAGLLETLQKIATAVHRLDALAEDVRELPYGGCATACCRHQQG